MLENLNKLNFFSVSTERGDIRNTYNTETHMWESYCTINLSSEYTTLIKEAANCRYYASDLLIDLMPVMKDLDAGNLPKATYFGFRDMGVDHDTFINARLDTKMYGDPRKTYREIYKLEFEHIRDGEFMATLSVWDGDWEEE